MSRLVQLGINTANGIIAANLVGYGIRVFNWWVVGLGFVWAFVGLTINNVIDQKSLLHAALAKLHSKLVVNFQIPESADLRAAVFTPGWVLQFVLVGTARYPNTERGRTRMLIYQGVAGRCFRTKQIAQVLVTADYYQQLISELGFTRRAAKHFRLDRKAFLCLPILNARQRVIGVLSLDAKSDVFTPEVIAAVKIELATFYQALAVF